MCIIGELCVWRVLDRVVIHCFVCGVRRPPTVRRFPAGALGRSCAAQGLHYAAQGLYSTAQGLYCAAQGLYYAAQVLDSVAQSLYSAAFRIPAAVWQCRFSLPARTLSRLLLAGGTFCFIR